MSTPMVLRGSNCRKARQVATMYSAQLESAHIVIAQLSLKSDYIVGCRANNNQWNLETSGRKLKQVPINHLLYATLTVDWYLHERPS